MANTKTPLAAQEHDEVDYASVTEVPGLRVHQKQLSALYTRYHYARPFCENRDVLEVACGAGMGLGYLAESAEHVVGGDIDENCLRFAEETYSDHPKVKVCSLTAEKLDFPDDSFDTLLMYEAIYYLPCVENFYREARRVLRPGGTLIVVSVNREWGGFNPSPFSIRYYSAQELADHMRQAGFEPSIKVAFEDNPHSLKRRVIGGVRRVAVALNLIPKTMRGKEWLKRLFYGELAPVDRELKDGVARLEALQDPPPLDQPIVNYEVVYATGKLAA